MNYTVTESKPQNRETLTWEKAYFQRNYFKKSREQEAKKDKIPG